MPCCCCCCCSLRIKHHFVSAFRHHDVCLQHHGTFSSIMDATTAASPRRRAILPSPQLQTQLQAIGIISTRRIVQPSPNCSYGIIIASPPFFPVPFLHGSCAHDNGSYFSPTTKSERTASIHPTACCKIVSDCCAQQYSDGISRCSERYLLEHTSLSGST